MRFFISQLVTNNNLRILYYLWPLVAYINSGDVIEAGLLLKSRKTVCVRGAYVGR